MKSVTLSTHSSFAAGPTPLNNRGYRLSLTRASVNIVVVILGILAAIAIPTCIGQQHRAKDAAMAQLRMAATSQQLHYVDQNAYAGNITDLEAYGFRQGAQLVTVVAADGSTYCMQASGGAVTFMITQAQEPNGRQLDVARHGDH